MYHQVSYYNLFTFFIGRKLWGFPRFSGDCASIHRRSDAGTSLDQRVDITDSCSQMILQLHNVYDPNKVHLLYFIKISKVTD